MEIFQSILHQGLQCSKQHDVTRTNHVFFLLIDQFSTMENSGTMAAAMNRVFDIPDDFHYHYHHDE